MNFRSLHTFSDFKKFVKLKRYSAGNSISALVLNILKLNSNFDLGPYFWLHCSYMYKIVVALLTIFVSEGRKGHNVLNFKIKEHAFSFDIYSRKKSYFILWQ